nr:hypothetical protein [Chloroflexota bacterium]
AGSRARREQETQDTAPCGHPLKVQTTTGRCPICIAEKHADPARAAAEEHGRALRLAVGT